MVSGAVSIVCRRAFKLTKYLTYIFAEAAQKIMKISYFLGIFTTFLSFTSLVNAQDFRVIKTGIFEPQSKRVSLLQDSKNKSKEIIFFKTNLRVNTDGSPLSYHPQDPRGRTLAINNICNGIAVQRVGSTKNLCLNKATYSEAISIFETWRDSGFVKVPTGYKIIWKNVLAATKKDGIDIPCTFKEGQYKGYFGSLTALKNGLTSNMGECEVNNQVNSVTTPALVLVGGSNNIVRGFGARVGDLLIAYNPQTQLLSAAVIGDTGPTDNLGEGSVFLNMRLLGRTNPPTNQAETYRLAIDQALIAIIPGSKRNPPPPYTKDNIDQRVQEWLRGAGFTTTEQFIKFLQSL